MRERRCAVQSARFSRRAAVGLWLTLGMVAWPAGRAGQAVQGTPKPPGPGNKARAESEIKEGARAYAVGDFVQAQAHYRAALELDPAQKSAAFFLARSMHAQYRPGLQTPENIAKAREAIAAYQRIVADNPNHDEAYEAVVVTVVDTGIDYNHPDLADNVWSAPADFTVTIGGMTITCVAGTHGFNAIANLCDPMDDNNHGTHVSGTIGAVGNNGLGVVGVNWTASIMGPSF